MNFRSSSVQPALIKTSVVGNVSKETGIHRERKKHKQNIQSHTQRRRENSKIRVGGTMGFPHQAFIICDLKSYQSSTARMHMVASNYSNPRRSGRAGKHYAVNVHLLRKRDNAADSWDKSASRE